MIHGKKILAVRAKVDKTKLYNIEDAVKLMKECKYSKFDETVDVQVKLIHKSYQNIRGTANLPAGTGKEKKVLVICKGEKQKEAQDAGADYVGAEDMVEKIQGGWLQFDKAIATPDMMGQVSKLGKILGPRGLMPNPKVGTVTFDLEKAIREIKAGKVEFKVEKSGIVHVPVGKASFEGDRLIENIKSLMDTILRIKPPTSKGIYLRSITLASTMGPGIKIDPLYVRNVLR
jgi:large subunit ribosomal protein L1